MTKDPDQARSRLSLTKFRAIEERAQRLYGARPAQRDEPEPPTLPAAGEPAIADSIAESTPAGWTRLKIRRDHDRPLEFDGVELAKVEEVGQAPKIVGASTITRAALYQTRGGKFVTEFTRFETGPVILNPRVPRSVFFAKAGVFDSKDVAVQWFRKGGRFTLRLLEQLGELGSEFIE